VQVWSLKTVPIGIVSYYEIQPPHRQTGEIVRGDLKA